MPNDKYTTLRDENEMIIVCEQALKNTLITQNKPAGVYMFADHDLINSIDFAYDLYQLKYLDRFRHTMNELQSFVQSMRLDVEINIYVLTDDHQFYYFDDV